MIATAITEQPHGHPVCSSVTLPVGTITSLPDRHRAHGSGRATCLPKVTQLAVAEVMGTHSQPGCGSDSHALDRNRGTQAPQAWVMGQGDSYQASFQTLILNHTVVGSMLTGGCGQVRS